MFRLGCAPLLLLFSLLPAAAAVVELPVKELNTQTVGDVEYFRVTIACPDNLSLREPHTEYVLYQGWELDRRALGQVPRLVPTDPSQIRDVYLIVSWKKGTSPKELSFVGRRPAEAKTKSIAFHLIYPTRTLLGKGPARLPEDRQMDMASVSVDWAKAKVLSSPKKATRSAIKPPAADDLQGQWAIARGLHFAHLELRAPSSPLAATARKLTGRRYGVFAEPHIVEQDADAQSTTLGGLYSLLTGATHLDEAVSLKRLDKPDSFRPGRGVVAVSRLPRIELAQHPWKEMIGTKKPAAEPLAKLVPHVNYYFALNNPAALLGAWDILDTWGGSVLRPPQMLDRDHGLRQRYRHQMCLPSEELVKALPVAGLVRTMVITGSDLYWQEGTDIAVLFDVSATVAFTKLQTPILARAAKQYGKDLVSSKSVYRKVTIESWQTPHREISLYRAVLGDGVVVCSNSWTALTWIVYTRDRQHPSLADALDFQDMRTVFPRDARSEDGFLFLSDAFIRWLVSPTTRIRAWRRHQARSALTLATHAALFVGQDSGRLPDDMKRLLGDSRLDEGALLTPEGKPIEWNGKRQQAVSREYGTLAFSTPLVELPVVDFVTKQEEELYLDFSTAYRSLWGQFFDPVGLRFRLEPGQSRLDIHILPLIRNTAYVQLRLLTAGAPLKPPMKLDPTSVPEGTAIRLTVRVSDWFKEHGGAAVRRVIKGDRLFLLLLRWFTGRAGSGEGDNTMEQFLGKQLGDRAFIHLTQEGLNLEPLVSYWIGKDFGRKNNDTGNEQLLALPWSLGAAVVSEGKAAASQFLAYWEKNLKGEAGHAHKLEHKKEPFLELPFEPDKVRESLRSGKGKFYKAIVDKVLYLTLDEDAMKNRIDEAIAARKAKAGEPVRVHASLHLAPPTKGKAGEWFGAYLDWQMHLQAQSALATWEMLYRSGLVTPKMTKAQRDETLLRTLGYVPSCPDGSAFEWSAARGEVRNLRHGSLSEPRFQGKLEETDTKVTKLLSQLRSVRVDFRFREDGMHTSLTLDWLPTRK